MRLINADAFKMRLDNQYYVYLQACYEDLIDAIDCEVTYFTEENLCVDVRPHGVWKESNELPKGFAICSNCNDICCCMGNFCPNCGSDMKESNTNGVDNI